MKSIRLFTLLAACLFAMAALAQQNPPAQERRTTTSMAARHGRGP